MAKKRKDVRAPERVARDRAKGTPGMRAFPARAGGPGNPEAHGKAGPRDAAAGNVNLFERLWNRRKFDVVGKKVKGEQKRLGKSRSDAIERRKSTLLQEYKQRNKANAFIDRRFGEHDDGLMEDEKAILRFQRERQAQLSRRSKYNLKDEEGEEEAEAEGEEDVLTHRGAALASLDDFEDDVGLDEEDELPGLDAEMVRELHFGGGARGRGGAPGEEGEDGNERSKSKKEAMEELIAKSKYYKAEKQKQRDEDENIREKLDAEYRQLSQSEALLSLIRPKKKDALLSLLKSAARNKGPANAAAAKGKATGVPPEEEDQDDYEQLAKSLVFEMRAHAGERMKTPEEAAKAERERLLELEKKRKRRMAGEASSDDEEEGEEGEGEEDEGERGRRRKKKRVEISGDDLGENFVIEEEYQEKGWVDEVLARRDVEAEDEDESGEEEDESGEEDEDEEGEEEEDGEEEEAEGEEGGSEEEEEEEEEEESEEGGGKFGGLDLGEGEWEQSDDDDLTVARASKGEDPGAQSKRRIGGEDKQSKASKEGKSERAENGGKGMVKSVENGGMRRKEERRKEELMEEKAREAARQELPYFIEAPQSLEEMRALVDGRSPAELAEAMRRIRACNAISLAAENRRKMQIFYSVLLQYFVALAGERPLPLARLDVLTAPLVELSAATPLFAAVCARERLLRMQQQLSAKLRAHDPGSSCWPSVRTLLLLRLWALIFPPSDFRHPVATPAFLLVGEYLTRCPVRSLRDVALGAFLCSLLLAMLGQTGRFCPESLCFLQAVLLTAVPTRKKGSPGLGADEAIPQYLKEQVGSQPWLRLQGLCEGQKVEPLDFCKICGAESDDPMFQSDGVSLSLLMIVLQTLQGFVAMYKSLPSFPEIFSPFLPALSGLSESSLPGELEKAREALEGAIKAALREAEEMRQPLRMRTKKPVPIKQFNPIFEEDFVKGRDYDPDRERAERKKLQRLIKKEARGAARELRKDNYFLAEERRREQAAVEEERDEKYKKAMAFLQEQEHAHKSGQLGGKKKRRGKR